MKKSRSETSTRWNGIQQSLKLFFKLSVQVAFIGLALLILCFSIAVTLHGWEPVEGDTYSNGGTNVAGLLVFFGVAVAIWFRQHRTKSTMCDDAPEDHLIQSEQYFGEFLNTSDEPNSNE